MTRSLEELFICLVCILSFYRANSLCPKGYFKIEGMKFCFPLLTCRDISEIAIDKLIGFGSTKNVYLAKWNSYNVSLVKLRNREYLYDFYSGLDVLNRLGPSNFIVQLIGFCAENDVIVLEYHENNNALNFDFLRDKLSLKEKFGFCLNYANILFYLHNSPIGVRVNCDSNDLRKLLSQLLITKDLRLILSDVDALPEVYVNSTIKCGKKDILSNFVAPEQLWTGPGYFINTLMSGYDEKTDIWKLPEVCSYFLGDDGVLILQYLLFSLHKKCKNVDPFERPSARQVIDVYNEIYDNI